MRLYTPESLLYPVTVTKLLRQPGDEIDTNAPLFVYEYKSTVIEWDTDKREDVPVERTGFSQFESELEGTISALNVRVGQVITRRTLVADIDEPCLHEVQFGGMCANCGKDMTTKEYNTTVANTSRATVNTVHGHTELLISQAEATKADEEAKRRLLDSRRLSLVVDLDQTIIHATVDPTVAEWQRDTSNPNHDAVKDVRAFQLVDDGPGARGTWYYIKLRPGLLDFLQTISTYYELHIYTMGTRAYAENIARIIDPDRKIFGERILSRDESGSMVAKNLKRLFPVDTKMVVIIDDRGDVWHWSPNLVKVSPYDFFVGIGDINSSFLPKRPGVDTKPIEAASPASSDSSINSTTTNSTEQTVNSNASTAATATSSPPSGNGEVSAIDRIVSMAGSQDAGSLKEKTEEQDQTIATQLEHRPLLQKQKLLEAAEEEAKASPAVEATATLLAEDGETRDPLSSDLAPPKYRHNLLQDDDTELEYLGQSLRSIHRLYFEEYDREATGSKGDRVAELRAGHGKKRSLDELEGIPDAALIMNSMKLQVLAGFELVFSGVVPVDVDINAHDTAIWAKSFGATISKNITRRTTHVIASPERRTAKVRQAAKRGGQIAIVRQAWLFACFSRWRKVDETPYRIHSDAPAPGTVDGLPDSFDADSKHYLLSSSDEDAAQTEEDAEDGIPTINGSRSDLHSPANPQHRLELDTDVTDLEELQRHQPTVQRTDSSPTDTEVIEDWGDIDDELADFLGSENDDDDDDDDRTIDSETDATLTDDDSQNARPEHAVAGMPVRKRKRGQTASDAGDSSDDTANLSTSSSSGSRLQKRKREALARTSSLTNMASSGATMNGVAAGHGNGDGGNLDSNVEETGGITGLDGDDDNDDDDDLEAALAAEMERQSDEEDANGGIV